MKNILKKIIPTKVPFFVLLGTGLIVVIAFIYTHDPDLGWHLRNGQDILALGIPYTDRYSFSLPTYAWISYEWATDILLYLSYQTWGLVGLSTIFAVFITMLFLVAARISKVPREQQLVAAICGVIASKPILGVRPQMITLFGIALVLLLLFRYVETKKIAYLVVFPLIFLIWPNMHAGFMLGFAVFGLWVSVEIGKALLNFLLPKIKLLKCPTCSRSIALPKLFSSTIGVKEAVCLMVTGLVSFITSFINPYTWHLHWDVASFFLWDQYGEFAKKNVGEFQPVDYKDPMSFNFFMYALFLAVVVFFSRKKINFTKLILAIFFFLFALQGWRHMPIFIVASMPLLTESLYHLTGDYLSSIANKAPFVVLLGCLLFFIGNDTIRVTIFCDTNLAFCTQNTYPNGAVEYLKTHPIEGNIFNEYNWGGFLIWQYPEKKVYIDGRMANWWIDDVFLYKEWSDIKNLLDSELIEKSFERYHITHALLYKMQDISLYLVKEKKWEVAYEDSLSIVLVDPRFMPQYIIYK